MDTAGDQLIAALHGALDERRKELRLLHLAAQHLTGKDAGENVLEELVALIPPAFLCPDQVCVRVQVGERVYGRHAFPPGARVFSSGFHGPEGLQGVIEVASLPSRDDDEPAPDFLPEEEELIESLARLLGSYWQRTDSDLRLADAERRFRALFDNELDCVKVLDARRHLVEINPAGLRLLGRTEIGDLAGKSLDSYIHPDDLREYIRLHQGALDGKTTRGRYRILARGGTTRFLETINMPLHDGDGELKVLSVTSDLTRLVREEEKFRHLLDSSPDAMIIADARGVMRIVNRACENVFGYTRYELLGRPVEMLLPESYRNDHVKLRERYARKPRVRPMGMGRALKGRRKNGNEFPVEIALGPIHTEGEALVCATVRDLTGVREFEIALKEMADQVAVHTGGKYFDELAKFLSSHFGLHVAAVGMLDETGENIETVALARAGKMIENMTYPLLGSPSAHVVRERPRFHEKDIQALYPEDRWFRETGAEGYAGVPLHDRLGQVIGLISATSQQALVNVAGIESFFKLAAARASAELDRIRQLEEIRESERRYSLVESGTEDGVWDLDMQTRNVYYSPRIAQLLGVSPDELGSNAETFWNRVHPDDVLRAREARHAHIQDDAPFDIQYRARHANGTYRWFRTRGRVVRDAEGKPQRFVGNVTDISEGKRNQLQLKAENAWLAKFAAAAPLEDLLETIVATASDVLEGVDFSIWMLTRHGNLRCFPGCKEERLVAGAMRSLALLDAVPDRPLTADHAQWPWQHDEKQVDRVYLDVVSADDIAERVVVALSYPKNLVQQRHERHFLEAAARLVGLALNRLQQQAALERQRLLFENLFESSPEAMVILDRHDHVLDVNPRFTEVFQFTAEESRGQPLNELIVPMEFAREAQNLSDNAMRGTNVSHESFRRRKDGSLVPVSILGAPVTVQGTEASYFAVYRDQSSLHEAAQRLEHQARHDLLTGLPNRYEFERTLQHAMVLSAKGQGFTGVLYFDLDQFKVINDTAGHGEGDTVLQEVTARLASLVPAPHMFARLGGDEFAVLLINGRLEDCERLAQQIRERLSDTPFHVGERTFALTASFGIVAVDAGTALDAHEVLSLADSASFIAKEKGRNRIQVHDASDMGVIQRREEMDWISRINEALVENRFKLNYQRIVPVDGSRHAEHYEILLRMVDRSGDVVPPGVFIPPAERFNLMPRIDRWVLEQVFARLGARGLDQQENLVVAVNISGNTLSDESLPEFVVSLFEQHAVRPQAICFEITETAAIGNFQDALKFIAVVRQLGCTVALDDFGSGLSSFRYLKEIAPDYLKIDGSFVREITSSRTDYSMVEAINRVGKIIGVRTIAEFVEDENILAALRAIGVDDAQGYGIHRPEPWTL